MNRSWIYLFFAFFVMNTSCGPSPDQVVAELVVALTTKSNNVGPITNPSPVPSGSPVMSVSLTLPSQISCNGDVFTISGTSFSFAALPNPAPSYYAINAQLNATGPGLPNPSASSGASTSSSTSSAPIVNCSFIIKTALNSGRVTTPIAIPNCSSGYECIFNGSKIDCGTLQNTIASTTCQ